MTSGRQILRVDAGGPHGLGHIRRSAELAKILAQHSNELSVFTATPEVVGRFLGDLDLEIRVLESETQFLKLMVEEPPSTVLIDHLYDYSFEALSRLQKHRLLLLHNSCEGGFACDHVIFPILHLAPEVEASSRWRAGQLRVGLEYFVLNEDLITESKQPLGPQGGLAVTTGGSDPNGVLFEIVKTLQASTETGPIHLLIGQEFVHRERLERLYRQLPSQYRIKPFSYAGLRAADRVVSTMGTTVYELSYLGRRCGVVSFSEDMATKADRLEARLPGTMHLGHFKALEPARFQRFLSSDGPRPPPWPGPPNAIDRITKLMTKGSP